MIDNIQRKRIIEKILGKIYREGRVPSYKELISILSDKLKYKELGKPLLSIRSAARGSIVHSADLKANVEEIKEDLFVAFEDINGILTEELVTSNLIYGEGNSLKQKLVSLNEELDSLLLKQYGGGLEIFYDNFRDSSKVDKGNLIVKA